VSISSYKFIYWDVCTNEKSPNKGEDCPFKNKFVFTPEDCNIREFGPALDIRDLKEAERMMRK